ncbi:hypothetical protein [Vibrio splendidus]|uniref:hypothetical protein n=1 Tax=Vibrio splendidus TaxID=29497 RepID=UPI000D344775|nr:hypothetical protein [Vibrio splendidus]PTP52460.1 hypothetical protein CWO05_14845 [Vibrio splendidus]
MDPICRYEFKLVADDLNLLDCNDVTKFTRLLVGLSLEADTNARAFMRGQFKAAAYCTDANDLAFYEVLYDTPYPYLGCFQTFYDWIVSETDPNLVKYRLCDDDFFLPRILPLPANEMVSNKTVSEVCSNVLRGLCDQVIRIENIDIHPALQKKGIFKALVTKLLDNYSYVIITAVINRKWAVSLKPKALEVYEEARGTSVLLNKSFLD